jgi:shikimate kinase
MISPGDTALIKNWLGSRSIVLIGLMGAGKTTVGRRLAARLHLPFADSDHEVELAAGQSIADIFAEYGEAFFREGERKVIARLLKNGPQILATGGGAFLDAETLANVRAHGYSLWLRAELRVLMERVQRKKHRPLLREADPVQVMRDLMKKRHPVYALADFIIDSREVPHEVLVNEIIEQLTGAARK